MNRTYDIYRELLQHKNYEQWIQKEHYKQKT